MLESCFFLGTWHIRGIRGITKFWLFLVTWILGYCIILSSIIYGTFDSLATVLPASDDRHDSLTLLLYCSTALLHSSTIYDSTTLLPYYSPTVLFYYSTFVTSLVHQNVSLQSSTAPLPSPYHPPTVTPPRSSSHFPSFRLCSGRHGRPDCLGSATLTFNLTPNFMRGPFYPGVAVFFPSSGITSQLCGNTIRLAYPLSSHTSDRFYPYATDDLAKC